MPSFNLIDEPFIPCQLTNGEFAEYGIRDALLKAPEIAELRDSSPLVTIALHRLLLAVLHSCYRGPRKVAERVAIYKAGRFDADRLAAYLTKWHERFDLFHEKYPFYQRAGFQTKEPSGVNRLAQELSRGNNAVLFDHTTDDPPPAMSPAQAAHVVVAEQVFAVGGGVTELGMATNAPLVAGAIVLVRGATLFETLWLNLTVYDASERPIVSDENDAPIWKRNAPEHHREPTLPIGYLDYLTWQTRTLRFLPVTENDRVVVRKVYYAQGRKCEPGDHFQNPMVAYSRKDLKEPLQPVRFHEYRDLWRDSAALYQARKIENGYDHAPRIVQDLASDGLRAVLPPVARYRVSVFGLCSDKAKVNFWRHESFPMPLAYLDSPERVESLKEALRLAENVVDEALRKAVWATAASRLTGGSGMSPDKKRVGDLVDSFAPYRFYWSRIELPYRELIVEIGEAASSEARRSLHRAWFDKTLRPTAVKAFDETIGRIDGSRDLKAVTHGRDMLLGLLRKLQPLSDNPTLTKEGAA